MPEDMIVNIDGMNVVVQGMEKIKVDIGIPTGRSIDSGFVKTIFDRLSEWTNKYAIVISIDTTIPIDLSRNRIVEMAKKQNCDYIFFIDSDVIIEEGQLERLISHNKDIVTGIYNMKVPPYYQLPRKHATEGLYTALELDGDQLVEIDGNGMGCALIKMNVFDKIPYPWFEFKYYEKDGKWEQTSEDLTFCQKLQSAGIKIYCDPLVQCAHVGTTVHIDLTKKYKEHRVLVLNELDKTIEELIEFTGMSKEDVHNKWRIATQLVAKEYKEYMQEDHRNPKDFYKTNKNYIFDLTSWHMSNRKTFDIDLIKNIKKEYPFAKKILDFGSGCGQNAIELANAGYDVSITDYDSYTSRFARFRAKKRGLNIKFYDVEMPIDDKFDIILAFDILEHVPDSEFEKTIYLLKSLKRDGGKIITTVSFGTQGGIHPMHYDETDEKRKLIEQLND